MTTETKFRGGLTMALMGLIIMTFFYLQQQDELQRCKLGNSFLQGGDIEKAQIINERDNLRGELFNMSVDLGRYETALEIFKERNKKGAEEFELIITTQTE